MGRRRLDAGSVWVLGGRPGEPGSGVPGPRIGYMPQDVALVGELTVRETLLYFGWLFGMTDDAIGERIAFLQQLLDLPPLNKFVKMLRCARRVSTRRCRSVPLRLSLTFVLALQWRSTEASVLRRRPGARPGAPDPGRADRGLGPHPSASVSARPAATASFYLTCI